VRVFFSEFHKITYGGTSVIYSWISSYYIPFESFQLHHSNSVIIIKLKWTTFTKMDILRLVHCYSNHDRGRPIA